MNNLLAKQAEEVCVLANTMGIAFPYGIVRMLREDMRYGTDIFDPIAYRMIFHLIFVHKCYGFVFGYISESELINEYFKFQTFRHKFGTGGEYEQYKSFDSENRNMAIRYARLLP